jgi:lipopolysaccharide biosynthesis glycosyltransferase
LCGHIKKENLYNTWRKKMNIVFATSDLYSRPALITIKTLLMNNKNVEELNIYYVENGVSEENKTLISRLVESYKRNIVFIPMPEEYLSIKGLIRTNAIVYSYCFFQDILPKKVEKVILLEGDSNVTDDLSEMYDIDLDGYYLGAADDLQSKWYKRKLGMKDDSPYFNCGIMVMNLKKWREDGVSEKLKKMINNGEAKFFYEVQDELNVLMEGQIKILPPKFNCTTAVYLFDYEMMKIYRKPSTYCNKVDFEYSKKHPLVVHFTKNQIIQPRPWIKDSTHPYKEYYEAAKKDTSLANMELWDANRGVANKVAYALYSKGAKRLLAHMLGWIHSFLYPMFLYRFILR